MEVLNTSQVGVVWLMNVGCLERACTDVFKDVFFMPDTRFSEQISMILLSKSKHILLQFVVSVCVSVCLSVCLLHPITPERVAFRKI